MTRAAQAIEDALWEAARATLDPAGLRPGALTAAIAERTRRYTSERERLDEPLLGAARAADLAARALFFTPTDATKVQLPLAELARSGRLPRGGRWRLLDLGAGCGAMALGALPIAAAHGAALEITAIDRDEGALAILARALPAAGRALGVPVELAIRRETVVAAPLGRGGHDLVIAGHLLNELPAEAHVPLVAGMLAAAAPDGVAIAIEPALRETARALHRVRAALLEGGAEVLAPCTHRAACPMLADERDWCHEERPLGLPERTGRLAHETGLRDDGGLCFAYLVLAHRPTAPVATAPGEAALRVVSHPSHPKGKVELDACGADGLVPLRLLRRHRADGNRGFERARRGDVLVLGEGALAPAIPGKPRDLAPGASVALHAIARDDR